uniref:Ig-like domain-containing protein n=1 Tax=Monopterus albus TaxID=43700 RepID=A0A3Q3IPT2_MONAL
SVVRCILFLLLSLNSLQKKLNFCAFCLFVSVQRNLTTDLGGMITLLCQAPSNMTILGVRWTRPDLNPKHVLSLQDGQLDLINQHPSFRNRVELVSRQLTNGDLSLVLKDVRAGDRGTYECRYRGRRGAVSVESEPVSLINLTASQSGEPQEEPTVG